MKNRISVILPFVLSCVLICSCQKQDDGTAGNDGPRELRFTYSVNDLLEKDFFSRAYEGSSFFFEHGDEIDVSLKAFDGSREGEFTYVYDANNNVFKANPGYIFALDDMPVSLITAQWPKKELHTEVPRDQRTKLNYHLADWMTAEHTLNVMPTDVPVPLEFERTNSQISFVVAGQYANGVRIKELIIELVSDTTALEVDQKAAYFAYCDDDEYNATLIVPSTGKFSVKQGAVIGLITIVSLDGMSIPGWEDKDERHMLIASDDINFNFKRGERYVMTITPKGYNMILALRIGGFGDGNGGIAAPFPQPQDEYGNFDSDGYYYISTPEQLITMSYLIRHYTPDDGGINWPSSNYVMTDALIATLQTMTPEQLAKLETAYYNELTPGTIDRSPFTGNLAREGTNAEGDPIIEIDDDLKENGIALDEDTYFKLIYSPVNP